MLKVAGRRKADLCNSYRNSTTFDVERVSIDQPDTSERDDFVWDHGREQGAAAFARLEGCRYGNGRIYIVSTSGGIGRGQIWEYNPAAETISLLFESPGKDLLDEPDHITVSPRARMAPSTSALDEAMPQAVHRACQAGDISPESPDENSPRRALGLARVRSSNTIVTRDMTRGSLPPLRRCATMCT